MSLTQEIIDQVKEIPLLSTVATRLLSLLSKRNYSVRDIVRLIESDSALTVKVLRVANSAAYARGGSITSLNRAIMHIGEMMVVSIAIGSYTDKLFDNSLEGYDGVEGDLWNHSLHTAIAARKISEYSTNNISGDLAFTSGLLHDIGKSTLSAFLKGRNEKILIEYLSSGQDEFVKAEDNILGTNHAEVGSAIALHWGLPESLIQVIKNHHSPADSVEQYKHLVYSVHLGDAISMMGGSGTGIDTLAYKIDPEYTSYIEIDEQSFARVLFEAQEEYLVAKSASLNSGGSDEN